MTGRARRCRGSGPASLNLGEPRLLAKVNAALSDAKAGGELNRIVLKWLKTPLPEKLLA